MNTTTNLGLKKPEYSDQADIGDINYNMEILDDKLGAVGNTSVQGQINAVNTMIGSTVLPTTAQTLTGAIAEHETDLGTKADKVTGATNGHFAGLDENGNLTDSGKQTSDFVGKAYVDDTAGIAGSIAKSDSTEEAVKTFTDGADNLPMKSVVAQIACVQDLHGYDNPYPAGGGKNLLAVTTNQVYTRTINDVDFTVVKNEQGDLISVTANGTASARTTIVLNADITQQISSGEYILSGCPSGGGSGKYRITCWDDTSSSTLANDYGSGATFTLDETHDVNCAIDISNGQTVNNIVFKPMIRLSSVSDDTFASYSNICPISGWTGMNIQRTGRNLYAPYTGEDTSNNGFTFHYNNDGSIDISGSSTSESSGFARAFRGMRLLKPGTYKKPAKDSNNIYLYVQYILTSSNWNTVPGGGSNSTTFEITQEIYDNYEIIIRIGVSSGTTLANTVTYYPYIYKSTDTDLTWVSPVKDTYEVSWQTEAGTVYHGSINPITGVLTVDYVETTVNDCSWEYDSDYTRFKTTFSGIKRYSTQRVTPMYCSAFAVIDDGRAVADVPDNAIYGGGTNTAVYIKNTTYTDATQFKTAFADVQIVYPLATPVTYQLTTPVEIRTLLGENDIFADCGNIISVDYYADTKTYIDSLFNSIVNATGVSF